MSQPRRALPLLCIAMLSSVAWAGPDSADPTEPTEPTEQAAASDDASDEVPATPGEEVSEQVAPAGEIFVITAGPVYRIPEAEVLESALNEPIDPSAAGEDIDLDSLGKLAFGLKMGSILRGQTWFKPTLAYGTMPGTKGDRPHPIWYGLSGGRRFFTLGRNVGPLLDLRGRVDLAHGPRSGGYDAHADALVGARLGVITLLAGPGFGSSRYRVDDGLLRASPTVILSGLATLDARYASVYAGFSPRFFTSDARAVSNGVNNTLPGFGDEWAWQAGVAVTIGILRIGVESIWLETALGPIHREGLNFKLDLTGGKG